MWNPFSNSTVNFGGNEGRVCLIFGFSFLSWSNSSISYCGIVFFAYFRRRSDDESESVVSDSLDDEDEGAHRFRDAFFFFFLSLSSPESEDTLSRRSVGVTLIKI